MKVALPIALLVFALFACSKSDESPKSNDEQDPPTLNAASDYTGPTKGGPIPYNTGGEDHPDAMTVTPDLRCCNVTLSIGDPTGDEAVHVVRGDATPLNDPNGLALTYANGMWSATACLPVNTYITYYFDFGGIPEDDSGASDASIPDLRYNPDVENVFSGKYGRVNTFGSVPQCTDVDASTGTLPP